MIWKRSEIFWRRIMETKPGYKTTEFAIALVTIIVSGLVHSGKISQETAKTLQGTITELITILAPAIVSSVYIIRRLDFKKKEIEAKMMMRSMVSDDIKNSIKVIDINLYNMKQQLEESRIDLDDFIQDFRRKEKE